jgi:hypothetical protein
MCHHIDEVCHPWVPERVDEDRRGCLSSVT